MKNIIIINAVNLALLFVFTGIYFLIGAPIWFVAVYACWIVYMIIVNLYMLHSSDKMKVLAKYKRKGRFVTEIETIESAVQTADFYQKVFEKYETGDAIRDTYEQLSEKAYLNVDKAVRWLGTYNYEAKRHMNMQREDYIVRLSNNSFGVMTKLNELNDLVLKVEDSASATDMKFVDDILQSLKEVLNEDE